MPQLLQVWCAMGSLTGSPWTCSVPSSGALEPREDLDQGRLPRAVCPTRRAPGRGDFERHPSQRACAAEGLREAFDRQNVGGGASCPSTVGRQLDGASQVPHAVHRRERRGVLVLPGPARAGGLLGPASPDLGRVRPSHMRGRHDEAAVDDHVHDVTS
jgi:hypothetical protein